LRQSPAHAKLSLLILKVTEVTMTEPTLFDLSNIALDGQVVIKLPPRGTRPELEVRLDYESTRLAISLLALAYDEPPEEEWLAQLTPAGRELWQTALATPPPAGDRVELRGQTRDGSRVSFEVLLPVTGRG